MTPTLHVTPTRAPNPNPNPNPNQGAKLLSEALKKNKTLTALYLNHNNIGDLGLHHLLEALKNNTCAALVHG